MAYDRVVDSSALDGALRSTADAIRAKTGNEDALLFDAQVGFADAVNAISSAVGALPSWSGEVVQMQKLSSIEVQHGLNTTKMLVIVDALELTHSGPWETYRIITWSPEILTPHVRYPVGDMSTSPYVDETIPPTTQRTGVVMMQSGNATASAHWIATATRTGTEGGNSALVILSPDSVRVSPNNMLSIGTYRVTVIDLANSGIRFTEEDE